MVNRYHAVVWIDHREARVFHFDHTGFERLLIHPDNPTHHIHHKANSIGSGHAAEDQDFLHRVVVGIADAQAILITGPANAKTELVKYIHRHEPSLMEHIAGVETVDHPSDNALLAQARAYFKEDHQRLPRSI
jgi:stalled ribosome rescue protein Dom34